MTRGLKGFIDSVQEQNPGVFTFDARRGALVVGFDPSRGRASNLDTARTIVIPLAPGESREQFHRRFWAAVLRP